MQPSRLAIFKQVLWPPRAPVYALLGGAVSLFGDLMSFFTSFLSAEMLALLFMGITVVAALLCLQPAFKVNAADQAAVTDAVTCAHCNAFRFGVFATAALGLLMVIGQGQTATEVVGRELGLIRDDVAAIRDDVGDLHDTAQPQMIIKKPRSAAEHFNNAWIYHNIQRNPAKAREALQALYAGAPPRKMDAAQLYLETGTALVGRDALIEEMQALARKTGDATLLVAAARGAASHEAGDVLAAEARRMDPELPFAWWDVQRIRPPRIRGMTPADHLAMYQADQANIEKFRSLYRAQPASHFFFLPQFQGDLESAARQISESLAQSIAAFDDAVSGRVARRARAEAHKAMEEAQRTP